MTYVDAVGYHIVYVWLYRVQRYAAACFPIAVERKNEILISYSPGLFGMR